MIGIKRNTGFSGVLSKIKIFMNDQAVAKIGPHQQIELVLPNEEAKISVSQFGAHSNELLVKDGQVVEITNSSWLSLYSLFLFIALFFINFLLADPYQRYGFLFLALLSLVLLYFKNVFELKIIYP